MSVKDVLETLNDVVKTYHNLAQNLKTVENDVQIIRKEFSEIRLEHLRLEGRVSRLEEGRETIKAEMRAILAESLAKHESEFVRTQARLEIEYSKAAADLYKKYLDSRAGLPAPSELTSAAAKET